MLELNFSSNGHRERHLCEGSRQGDWLVYTCPQCDYQFWDHWQTGEIKVVNPKPDVHHSGSYFPPEYQQALSRVN